MKYVKILGLLALAATALMVSTSPAAAELTSPAGTTYGGTLHASGSGISIDGSVDVSCSSSTITAFVSYGSRSGGISALSFSSCNKDTVTPVCYEDLVTHRWECGSLSFSSSGIITANNIQVTVQLHRTVLGFPVTTHCWYKTFNTNVGTFTGGTPAKLDIDSWGIPQLATDGACGENAEWTGSYTIDTPSPLFAD